MFSVRYTYRILPPEFNALLLGFIRDPQPLTSAGRTDRRRLKADQII